MGGNYEKSIYNQLMDVMERLETFEKKYREDTFVLKRRINALEKENTTLKEENRHFKPTLHRPERRPACQHLQRKEESEPQGRRAEGA